MMKMAILAATALLSSTIMSTPAFADTITPPIADPANQTTLDAMQTQCDALAALHGPATATTIIGQVKSPRRCDFDRRADGNSGQLDLIDTSSIQPLGDYVPGTTEIRGDPFRTGGSVNLFGEQWSTAGYYPDSTYNFTADFNSTFAQHSAATSTRKFITRTLLPDITIIRASAIAQGSINSIHIMARRLARASEFRKNLANRHGTIPRCSTTSQALPSRRTNRIRSTGSRIMAVA